MMKYQRRDRLIFRKDPVNRESLSREFDIPNGILAVEPLFEFAHVRAVLSACTPQSKDRLRRS